VTLNKVIAGALYIVTKFQCRPNRACFQREASANVGVSNNIVSAYPTQTQ